VVLVKICNNSLVFKIPDLNRCLGGSTEPVSGGREDQRVDDISGIHGVKVLAFVEVPETGGTVLAAGSAERAVGGNGDGVNVAAVSDQVGSQLAVGEVPYLNEFIPSTRYDNGISSIRGESNGGDPFGVSLLFDGVLALTEGVPELNGLITRSGYDLSVISRECNGKNVLGVSDESSGGGSKVEVPESEGGIP